MSETLKTKLIGFGRALLSVAIFGATVSVLTFLSDATHLSWLGNDSISLLIAGLAASWEHSMEARGAGALFGAVKTK